MPCSDPRDSRGQAALKYHHRQVEELIEDLFETRDLERFERAYRSEQALYETDKTTVNSGGADRALIAERSLE